MGCSAIFGVFFSDQDIELVSVHKLAGRIIKAREREELAELVRMLLYAGAALRAGEDGRHPMRLSLAGPQTSASVHELKQPLKA